MSNPEIFRTPLSKESLRRLANESFEDMVKFAVDLERRIMCAGGGMHSDEEALLLLDGSKQSDLWGGNYYLDAPEGERLEFTSMINVRSRDENTAQEVQSPQRREKITELATYFFETAV